MLILTDDKQPYEKKAAKLKEKYEKDIAAYRAKGKPNAAKRKSSRLKKARKRRKRRKMRKMKRMKRRKNVKRMRRKKKMMMMNKLILVHFFSCL